MLCMSVFVFFQYSHINCDHHGDRSCIPNILSVRIWTWHAGTMKGYGYEQIMEGHGSNAHERKVEMKKTQIK